MHSPGESIAVLPGIGPQRVLLLRKLGICTLGDLILHLPREYQDRSRTIPVGEAEENAVCQIRAFVIEGPENARVNGKTLTKLKACSDGEPKNVLEAIWFNQPYLKKNFQKNIEYIFIGKPVYRFRRLIMESPDYEPVTEAGESLSTGRIVPVYPLTQGISQKILRGFIRKALDSVRQEADDPLPVRIKEKFGLCEHGYALAHIHFPDSDESFYRARRRLVFEELFMLQAALSRLKGAYRRKAAFSMDNTETEAILKVLPFTLTRAQMNVLEDIRRDFQSGMLMNRLIQGDVGSGKTAVAMAACFIAVQNGFQAVLMAPTEVLAKQHEVSFRRIFDVLGLETVLLTGSLTPRQKESVRERIQTGQAHMVVGTHALIQDRVDFARLGLVITDEQHRFGVGQRLALSAKGTWEPHVLVMTATPIPRTLALILYGDMDISMIREMPPGRQKVETYAVNTSYRERIYGFIRKQREEGHQSYVICPMIEEPDDGDEAQELSMPQKKAALEMESVTAYTEKLQKALPDLNIECLHGKMKQDVKQSIMERFAQGHIDSLVSTTVIEVGINVPNATLMVIENAERFGLSQLHQLRGRVGRGADQSYCVLVSDSHSKVCRERLRALSRTNDGFELSELDLELRGAGDFFGTRQHGLPSLKIANLYKDMDILNEAQQCVRDLMEEDGNLEKDEHRPLREEIDRFWNAAGTGVTL